MCQDRDQVNIGALFGLLNVIIGSTTYLGRDGARGEIENDPNRSKIKNCKTSRLSVRQRKI